MMKQKRYFDTDEYVSLDYETLGDFRKSLDNWIEAYGTNARFIERDDYGNRRIVVQFEREETDYEYQKRLQDEQNYKEYAEKRDREIYEKLKIKFEGDK